MSSILSFTMPSSKKEKHYANSRARRHSGDVVISQSKKSKKEKEKKDEKDDDNESVTSSTPSSTSTETPAAKAPEPKKCPLRFMLAGLFEAEAAEEGKKSGCPLWRVQLWHILPLCLLAAVNLLLIIFALLGLAGYRIAIGLQGFIVRVAKSDLEIANPYAESSLIDIDDSSTVVGEEKQ